MPPRQLSPSINPPVALSSWPIVKYSYSVSPLSSLTQAPWTHFAHRDNIFLVVSTQRVSGYIQNDGKFSDQQMRLKIVWGLEMLESLDLTSLTQQTAPIRDLQQPNKLAFVVLGRSPSLAVRYFRAEDQTIHRFQIKFLSDTTYQSVVVLLEQANLSVGNPPPSRDETKYDFSPQLRARPPPSQINHGQVQDTPPSTSLGYSNASSLSGGTPGREPHLLKYSAPAYLNNVLPTQTHDPAVPATSMSSVPISSNFDESSRVSQSNLHSNISYVYLPGVATSPNEFLEDLPPPRPPLDFGSLTAANSLSTYKSKSGSINPISKFLPLPKPTPVSQPTVTSGFSVIPSLEENGFKYSVSRPDSNFGVKIDALYRVRDPPLKPNRRTRTYRPGLPGVVEEYNKSKNSGNRGLFPVFPNGDKKLEPESRASPMSISRKRIGVGTNTAGLKDANVGERRKQPNDEKEDQQQKRHKHVLLEDEVQHGGEDEEFRQIEDFIVDAIHDDAFLRLVERISGVWQKMGFDEVGVGFFDTGRMKDEIF